MVHEHLDWSGVLRTQFHRTGDEVQKKFVAPMRGQARPCVDVAAKRKTYATKSGLRGLASGLCLQHAHPRT